MCLGRKHLLGIAVRLEILYFHRKQNVLKLKLQEENSFMWGLHFFLYKMEIYLYRLYIERYKNW